ncbi:DUF4176 domain-containing protein [Faecalimicrobium sp. JNUCC 81]
MDNIFKNQLKLSFKDKKSRELKIRQEIISFFIELAERNLSTLKFILEHVNAQKLYKNSSCNLIIAFNKDTVTLNLNESSFDISLKNFSLLIINIIDLIEPIYPLGTVVNLKTKYLNNLSKGNKINEATFVIINRFIYVDGIKTYFQYTGIPYPVGSLGFSKNLYFTTELIDKVVHLGYSDDKEDAFIYMMKKELIIDKNYCSIGYASKTDRDNLNSLLKEVRYIGE